MDAVIKPWPKSSAADDLTLSDHVRVAPAPVVRGAPGQRATTETPDEDPGTGTPMAPTSGMPTPLGDQSLPAPTTRPAQ